MNKSNFTLRILESVKERVQSEAKQEGTSINKIGETLLLEALNARRDKRLSADKTKLKGD